MEQGSSISGSRRHSSLIPAASTAPLLLVLTANLGAQTSVFQCTTPDGSVEFRQRPCTDGANEQSLIIEDRKTGWVPSKVPIKDKPESKGKTSNRNRKSTARGSSAKARREEQCWKKRQLLEEVNWKLKRGYKAGQGNKLRHKRRSYEAYISQFCR